MTSDIFSLSMKSWGSGWIHLYHFYYFDGGMPAAYNFCNYMSTALGCAWPLTVRWYTLELGCRQFHPLYVIRGTGSTHPRWSSLSSYFFGDVFEMMRKWLWTLGIVAEKIKIASMTRRAESGERSATQTAAGETAIFCLKFRKATPPSNRSVCIFDRFSPAQEDDVLYFCTWD